MHKMVNGEQVEMTAEEIQEFIAQGEEQRRLQQEYEAKFGYINKRIENYPSIGDQLDMLYKAMQSGEIPVCQVFVDSIKRVKEAYPKPQSE